MKINLIKIVLLFTISFSLFSMDIEESIQSSQPLNYLKLGSEISPKEFEGDPELGFLFLFSLFEPSFDLEAILAVVRGSFAIEPSQAIKIGSYCTVYTETINNKPHYFDKDDKYILERLHLFNDNSVNLFFRNTLSNAVSDNPAFQIFCSGKKNNEIISIGEFRKDISQYFGFTNMRKRSKKEPGLKIVLKPQQENKYGLMFCRYSLKQMTDGKENKVLEAEKDLSNTWIDLNEKPFQQVIFKANNSEYKLSFFDSYDKLHKDTYFYKFTLYNGRGQITPYYNMKYNSNFFNLNLNHESFEEPSFCCLLRREKVFRI